MFLAVLQHQVNSALIRVEAPPRDLSPTSAINQLLSVMRDMLSTASLSEGRETDMGKVCNFSLQKTVTLMAIFAFVFKL